MKVSDFTDAPPVFHPIRKLQDHWKKKAKPVSDVVDAAGHQYVDLVMEGGGVLGIALVGYTYALESVGIRFRRIGGTSAGAINALLVAALDAPDKPKSGKLLEALANLKMFDFVDGDSDARDFVKSMVGGAGAVKLAWKGMQVLDNLNEDLGLNPGTAFFDWLHAEITRAGVKSVADLEARMTPPDLFTRDGAQLSKKKDLQGALAIIAADISTETKVVFPDMAALYWRQHRSCSPALFVRASMSIPGFFHPFRVTNIPQGKAALARWADKAGYEGVLPEEVLFVDGGIMSNFPIDIFHSKAAPRAPTFGVKLGVERIKPNEINKPLQMLGAIFDSARHCSDYDFLLRNPDYEQLVAFIHTEGHNWLDFAIEPDAKIDLFARGVDAAIDFLMRFEWDDYKKTRAKIAATAQTG